jgi:hypothetical protein
MTETDLLPAPTGGEILLPASLDEIREAMERYLEATKVLLDDPECWQGPPFAPDSFVKKEGWQRIAKAYRLSTEIVSDWAERDDQGALMRAGCIVRAIAPNGQHREATGYCDRLERRFESSMGRQKIENDLRNTAATRAENRAISNLCGVGKVSAEEAGQGASDESHIHGAADALPGWAQPGDAGQAGHQLGVILLATGADSAVIHTIGNAIFDACGDGNVPRIVCDVLDLIAEAVTAADPPITDAEVEG